MLNVILFGPPGSGKGTQSKIIIEKFKLVHLSTGDILRNEIATKTPLGIEAKSYIDRGALLPDNVVIEMMDEKITEFINPNGFIFDGFPRTVFQADTLDIMLKKHDAEISHLIELVVNHDELIRRLIIRGQSSGRTDDADLEIVEKRILIYKNDTIPVIDHYNALGKFYSLDGVGSVSDIYRRICRVIGDCR